MVDFLGFLPVVGWAFVDWLKLFIAPLKNFEMLWIIIPIWGVWLFSEFFQEKKGTSFGNAITNGATMVFVGVDWTRYVIRQISAGSASLGADSVTKMGLAAAIIILGAFIIVMGIKARSFVRLIGRVRETTYLMLMFSPVVYNVVELTLRNIAVILAFFPLFYILIEVLDKVLPTPHMFELEEEEMLDKEISGKGAAGTGGVGLSGLGSDFGSDVFGAGRQNPQFGSQFGLPQQPQQYPQQQKGKRLF
ncbi:hypothetical protein HYY73_05595 [Candidatus Woesearchaeota archaeon]|nr:hypothetical protein [Candidatus Woesearchaeota archaeon]